MTRKEEFRLASKVWDKIFGQIFTVESMNFLRRRQGIRYEVKKNGDRWTCNCKSWIFKSGTIAVKDLETNVIHERTCKHIRFVMEKEGMKIRKLY